MSSSHKKMKPKDIEKKLEKFSSWTANAKQTEISKTFSFPSFITALAFVAKITVHAEVMDHHPVIELSYGKVKVRLTTHEVKGLTQSDFELAQKIDRLKVT